MTDGRANTRVRMRNEYWSNAAGASQLSERVTFGDGDGDGDEGEARRRRVRCARFECLIVIGQSASQIGQLDLTRAHETLRYALTLRFVLWNEQ